MFIFAVQVIFNLLIKATEHLEEVNTNQLLSSPFFLMLRNGKISIVLHRRLDLNEYKLFN